MTAQDEGRRFERRAARELHNSKRVMGSGNLWFAKADIQLEHFLVECKATEAQSFILKAGVCDKIVREATEIGKYFAIAVRMGNRNYAVIDLDWLNFIEEQLMLNSTTTGIQIESGMHSMNVNHVINDSKSGKSFISLSQNVRGGVQRIDLSPEQFSWVINWLCQNASNFSRTNV